MLDPGTSTLTLHQLLSDREYREAVLKFGEGAFRVGMGAEAVREMLQSLNLDELSVQLRKQIDELTRKERDRETEGQKRARIVKRLEVVEAFRSSGNKPEWMILDVVPVIPPELRPIDVYKRQALRMVCAAAINCGLLWQGRFDCGV